METNLLKINKKICLCVAISFALMLLAACPQSAVAQSNTFPSSGNVGIGTTAPSQLLEIRKDTNTNGAEPVIQVTNASDFTNANWAARLRVSSVLSSVTKQGNIGLDRYFDSNGSLVISTDAVGGLTFSADNSNTHVKVLSNGNVGIGTTSPTSGFILDARGNLRVGTGSDASGSRSILTFNEGGWGTPAAPGSTSAGDKIILYDPGSGYKVAQGIDGNARAWFQSNSGTNGGFSWWSGATPTQLMVLQGDGNVGIGTPSPQYRLDVAGNINSSATITGNNIVAKYQDMAEWVPSTEQISAGTVVVLDSTKSNQVTQSAHAYDTRVAGVISERPGIALGEGGNNKVLVATTGRVRVKVDASRSPIHIGDLLVTSDIPGMAMKSEPVNIGGIQMHRPGTLIGKALEPLEKGSGAILVLLSLQ